LFIEVTTCDKIKKKFFFIKNQSHSKSSSFIDFIDTIKFVTLFVTAVFTIFD